MARYQEQPLKPWALFFILLGAFTAFFPLWMLNAAELYWQESTLALQALESSFLPPLIKEQGIVITSVPPFLPLLTGLLYRCNIPIDHRWCRPFHRYWSRMLRINRWLFNSTSGNAGSSCTGCYNPCWYNHWYS